LNPPAFERQEESAVSDDSRPEPGPYPFLEGIEDAEKKLLSGRQERQTDLESAVRFRETLLAEGTLNPEDLDQVAETPQQAVSIIQNA
jgi:hypothetical protein